jgi:hypothetical protein
VPRSCGTEIFRPCLEVQAGTGMVRDAAGGVSGRAGPVRAEAPSGIARTLLRSAEGIAYPVAGNGGSPGGATLMRCGAG